MEESKGEPRPDASPKLAQPVNIDAQVQTEGDDMSRDGKSYRGRGRVHWRGGGGRGGRGFKRRARGGIVFSFFFFFKL